MIFGPSSQTWIDGGASLYHPYLPIVCLVFGEVENLFGHLVPFSICILPSLQMKTNGHYSAHL